MRRAGRVHGPSVPLALLAAAGRDRHPLRAGRDVEVHPLLDPDPLRPLPPGRRRCRRVDAGRQAHVELEVPLAGAAHLRPHRRLRSPHRRNPRGPNVGANAPLPRRARCANRACTESVRALSSAASTCRPGSPLSGAGSTSWFWLCPRSGSRAGCSVWIAKYAKHCATFQVAEKRRSRKFAERNRARCGSSKRQTQSKGRQRRTRSLHFPVCAS
jgi:hypothetical protein